VIASQLQRLFHALPVLAAATLALTGAPPPDPFEYQQVHLGLPVRILLHVADRSRGDAAARAAFERIEALDRILSDYRPDSELRQLPTEATGWIPVGPVLLDVLDRASVVAAATDGAFDPTVGPLVALWREARTTGRWPDPTAAAAARQNVGWTHLEIDRERSLIRLRKPGMQLDLGGIAKGYILQRAFDVLRRQGVKSALIEAGGDIVVGAAPPGRSGWQITTPDADGAFQARAASLTHAALATSGSTEQVVEIDGVRYSHLVDPRTGVGVSRPVVASVIARDAATADALATAVAIGGPETRAAILRRFPEIRVSLSRR
jgi:thiamine biosynthesis lipoprotein